MTMCQGQNVSKNLTILWLDKVSLGLCHVVQTNMLENYGWVDGSWPNNWARFFKP